jgi:hypothetical protein
MQTVQDAKIKGISIWFYIIAGFQLFAAYTVWNSTAGDSELAQIAMAFATVDLVIGALFVLFGYFAAKKRPWAFVAGLVLYGVRAALEFFQFFSPITLLIRGFLLWRIFQGLQACLAANRADDAMRTLNLQRRLEMPQAPVAPAPQAWVPARGAQAAQPEGQANTP